MKKIISITTIALGTLSLAFGLFAAVPHVAAQAATTPGSGQALEIGPPVINLVADPGQTVKAQISLRDISTSKLIVTNEVNDFVANGEDGTPKILLKETEPNPYSMRTWITPLPQFTLVPKQIQTLSVTLKVPTTASPGGYYAVIRFTGTPPELQGTGVSLSASLGALVLLRVNGAAKEQMNVVEFSANKDGKTNWLFESLPVNFVERIKNDGNIHEQPIGQIAVTDMFGKPVAAFSVNSPPRNVLPNSIRKFDATMDSKAAENRWLFGKYTATLTLKYGTDHKVLTSTTTFWIIPYTLIAIIILILIAVSSALFFGIKRYNRYIISQARRRR